jgi:hypothetical protein
MCLNHPIELRDEQRAASSLFSLFIFFRFLFVFLFDDFNLLTRLRHVTGLARFGEDFV